PLNCFEVLIPGVEVIEKAGDRGFSPVHDQSPVVMGYEPLLPDEIFPGADPPVAVVDPDNPEVRGVGHLEGGEISGGIKLVVLDKFFRQRVLFMPAYRLK